MDWITNSPDAWAALSDDTWAGLQLETETGTGPDDTTTGEPMSFFQNVFTNDFEGSWVISDRQYSPTFKVPRNAGRGDDRIVVWSDAPYNLNGNDADGNAKNVLHLHFTLGDFRLWQDLNCTITATDLTSVQPHEIVAALNAITEFSDRFVASITNYDLYNGSGTPYANRDFTKKPRLTIQQKQPVTALRFYVSNEGAETVLRFNARSGVTEIPAYFARHTVDNEKRITYTDAQNALIALNPYDVVNNPTGKKVDTAVINNATDAYGVSLNLDASTVRADYLLLRGRAGAYIFVKNTYNGSSQLTAKLEYHAGAKTGDLARKTTYTYSGANVATSAQVPYVLQDADIITPA